MTAAAQRQPPPRLDQLVRDIEAAIASGDHARQSGLVVRSADALVRRWSRLPLADKPGFDRLLAGLLRQVDEDARAAFAARLTPLRRAPLLTATQLARDPAIRVARPLLEACQSFGDDRLTEIVSGCSVAHLCAVARRPSLSAALSLVLIRTGSPPVVATLLANPDAAVPDEALPRLMGMAPRSEAVSLALGARRGLSASDRANLVDLARGRARAGLARDGTCDDAAIDALLSRVAVTVATPVAPERAARFEVSAAIADGAAGSGPAAAARIERWVGMSRIEDALAALAHDAGLPIAVLVACYDAPDPTALAVVLRGLDHPWSLLKAFLSSKHGGLPASDLLSDVHRVHTETSPASGRKLARYAGARLGVWAFPPTDVRRLAVSRADLPVERRDRQARPNA